MADMDTCHNAHRPGAVHPARSGLRARAGFTLVEIMVASFVMLFAISSSIIVLQSGFRSLDTARKTTLASQIMQSEMERIRMLSWTSVSTLASEGIELASIFPQNTDLERAILAQMERTFTATRTVTPLAAYSNEIVEISVAIDWRGIDGAPHHRSSSTRYCKNGLYAYYFTVP
jgi:type II secretory pathway pseudopilin PulG